jgi:hypothetical protein
MNVTLGDIQDAALISTTSVSSNVGEVLDWAV